MRAVPAKSAKPVLQNVRLGDGLLTGTDLEVRIDREIDYHGEPMLLPAYRLNAILRAATGDEVILIPNESSITVKCGAGSWTLPTENVNEYPTWEAGELKAVCRLPADQFSRAAKATVYATDNESSRYALGGVLIDVKDGNPTWVATDGRRLACVETETDQAVDDSQTIIPGRLMAGSWLVPGWFTSGSLLAPGWFTSGSWLVPGWFTPGSLVPGWFMAGSWRGSWAGGGGGAARCGRRRTEAKAKKIVA